MAIVTLGIDLAKNVFAVHGVDATGRPVLVRPNVARAKLLELVATLPPCLIGMRPMTVCSFAVRNLSLAILTASLHRDGTADQCSGISRCAIQSR